MAGYRVVVTELVRREVVVDADSEAADLLARCPEAAMRGDAVVRITAYQGSTSEGDRYGTA